MGLIESKYRNSRSSKSNGNFKKAKSLISQNSNDFTHVDNHHTHNGGGVLKGVNGALGGEGKDKSDTKKLQKIKVFQSKNLDSSKVTNNSGHKSNHGKTKEDSDQKNKWTTIPRSAHSTIERLIKSLDYQIVEFNVTIDDKSSILAEKTSILKYKTPHFRAKASVIVPPLEKGDQAVVGWIQVVNSMIFVNRYGDHGLSSWEFPELTTGRQMMISDSDGHRYPWYGSKKEVAVLKGPTLSPSMLTVIMNDNFSPQVTWFVPAPNHRKTCKDAKLTRVFRKQSFTACLAVMKVANNSNLNAQSDIHQSPFNPAFSNNCQTPYNGLSILRAIKWELKVDIYIDPSKQVGERSTIPNGYLSTNQYFTINDPDILAGILDLSALHPPNANKSQTLIWRPFNRSMLRPNSTTALSSLPSEHHTRKPSPSVNHLDSDVATDTIDAKTSPSDALSLVQPTATTPSSNPPTISQASPIKQISPSLNFLNNLSSAINRSFSSHSKTASTSSSSSSSSSSPSSPLSNPSIDKSHVKLNISCSVDPLPFDSTPSAKQASHDVPNTRKALSHSTLLDTSTHASTTSLMPKKSKERGLKKSRVATNDRNKNHQSKLLPADGDTDEFRPLKVETVIVQPLYTKVDMHNYLNMTRGLSALLHKCVANDLESC